MYFRMGNGSYLFDRDAHFIRFLAVKREIEGNIYAFLLTTTAGDAKYLEYYRTVVNAHSIICRFHIGSDSSLELLKE